MSDRNICRHCVLDAIKAFAADIGPIRDAPPQCFLYTAYGDLEEHQDMAVLPFMLDGDPSSLWAVQIHQELHNAPEALGFFTVLIVEDTSQDIEGILITSYSRESDKFDTFFSNFEFELAETLDFDTAPEFLTSVDYQTPLEFH